MHIKLENIGIIKESTIALDGLTVITGKNNSGKSTVGKALYALLDAVCDLQDKAKKDRLYYIRTYLKDIGNVFFDVTIKDYKVTNDGNPFFFTRRLKEFIWWMILLYWMTFPCLGSLG